MSEQIRTSTILNARYQVQRILGEGGMGAVYLATDLQHRRPVAIKVARLGGLEARDQFRREAAFLKRLHHHSLPRVWDYFSDTQRDFLVMEYIPGEDLETLVHRQGPQPEWLVLRWADELLDGLDYLHNQDPPLIHRDIKPGNLKLRTDETLVLVDFGIATELRPEQDTDAGALAVTPGFSPPEQYSDQPTDARTDVYSVGATLYFLLTGQTPPAAIDRVDERAQLDPPSKYAARLSPSSETLVSKALSLDHTERWSSAVEMRHAAAYAAQRVAIASTAHGDGSEPLILPASPVKTPASATESSRRTGLALALIMLALALTAAGILAWRAGVSTAGATPIAEAQNIQPSPSATSATEILVPVVATIAEESAAMPTMTAMSVSGRANGDQAGATSGIGVTAVDRAAAQEESQPNEMLSPTSTSVVRAPISATATPERTPTPTPTPIRRTTTPTPAATIPTPVPPTATARAPVSSLSAALVSPGSGDSGNGTRTFAWQIISGALGPGEAYEVRFWKPGQNPLQSGLGVAGTTLDTSMTINLDGAASALPGQFVPGDYLWGVVLVNQTPYAAVRLVSDTWTFRYDGSEQPAGPPPGPTRQPQGKLDTSLPIQLSVGPPSVDVFRVPRNSQPV